MHFAIGGSSLTLTLGIIATLFGVLLALSPGRVLHPFKGKAVASPKWLLIVVRIVGAVLIFVGFQMISAAISMFVTN